MLSEVSWTGVSESKFRSQEVTTESNLPLSPHAIPMKWKQDVKRSGCTGMPVMEKYLKYLKYYQYFGHGGTNRDTCHALWVLSTFGTPPGDMCQ